MPTSSMLRAKGLNTFQNFLSEIPEGSLFEAENVVIDRDGVVEPRRGIKVNGDLPEISKQLLTYKDKILAHYGDALAFSDGNDPAIFTTYKKRADFQTTDVDTATDRITIILHGLSENDKIIFSTTTTLPAPLVAATIYYVANPTQNDFQLTPTPLGSVINLTTTGVGVHTAEYDYVIANPDPDIRIKSVEMNGNLYVTAATGIKKISALSPLAIGEAGGIKALNLSLSIDFSTALGFLDAGNEVAYRITWVTTDINDNLIQGSPSYRAVITNPSYDSRNIKINFPIPFGITADYSYRIFRTAQNPNPGGSGDEHKLVFEAQVTPAELLSGFVNVIDEQPEALRDSGLPLYTNEFSGEGILQSNDRPPIAVDIAAYKNTLFFANTTTNYKFNFNLLGQDALVHLVPGSISAVVFGAGVTTFTYPAGHGLTTNQNIVLVGTVAATDLTPPLTGTDGIKFATRVNATQFTLVGDYSAISKPTTSTFTSFITITKGSVSNIYYFVGRPEKHDITVTAVGAGIAGDYFNINSADNAHPYYAWLNDIGAASPTPDPMIANRIGIQIDYDGTGTPYTTTQIAAAVVTALSNTGDFTAVNIANLVKVDNANSGFATDATSGSATFTVLNTQQGFGEDAARHLIRLSSFTSPAAQIEDTAKSLTNVINQNSNDVVYAYYTADINDLPGSILLEAKLIDNNTFSLTASSNTNLDVVPKTTGAMFNPDLSTSQSATNESFPNRIYFSKPSQPEAVPATNNIDIGPKDKKILRILGLRDSLFILKEEGVYRLTGDTFVNFSVTLFDNSANLIAADTATILNNQIYALTSQGVATISETGVGIISRAIENIFTRVTSPSYPIFNSASFAFGYEADRAYLIFVADKTTDTFATKAYRYNTFTQCWTSWKKSATCGIAETKENKIYLGAADVSSVEVERKALTSRDYVDRQYNRNISLYSFGFVLDSVANTNIGDSLEQTQYLTAADYNRLLIKAKIDPYLLLDNTFPEITQTGSNLRLAMEALADELNASDTSLYTGSFNSTTNVAANIITIMGHGLHNNDVIKLSAGVPPGGLLLNTFYAVISATANTFQLSVTIGGAAIVLTPAVGSVTIKELYLNSVVEDFAQHQADFNYNVNKLNTSTGVFFTDYKESEGTLVLNTLITSVSIGFHKVTTANLPLFFQGPVVLYKSIKSVVVWAPISLGDPSLLKHIRSGTFLLESNVLAGATVAYASDLSGNFEDMNIGINQDGNWGEGFWGEITWGGEGTSVPIRVLIPRQKQRCRFIKARFKHGNAFNKFAILGTSYTFEIGSDRAYK